MYEQTIISSSSLFDNGESRTECCDQRFRRDFTSSQLIWLVDDIFNNNTIISSLKNLQELVDDTKLFDDFNNCKDFLEQTTDRTTFLVVSDQSEKSFIPQICHMKHIWSIHIYYQNVNKERRQERTESKVSENFLN